MGRLEQWLGVDWRILTVFEKVWLFAPVAVWFSFQPLMRLGQDSTMYFEVSITLLYLLVLAVVGIPQIWRGYRSLIRSRGAILVEVFTIWTVLGLLWTPNLTRGVLTAGVLGLLYLVVLASVASADSLKRLVPVLVKLFVVGAVVMSVLAIIQFVAGIWLAREVTLLCAGCVAEQFGFARPNVFAIEPQFFGSLLIAPLLLVMHRLLSGRWSKWVVLSFVLIAVALCLTLSRGAIFAFGAGALLLVIYHMRHAGQIAKVVALGVGAFMISLTMQGVAAASHPTIDETFTGAVSKVVNQLSLGVVSIPTEKPVEVLAADRSVPVYDGYVEESTDVRVNRSSLALQTWSADAMTMLVGVGVGGGGVAVHKAFPEQTGAREIVQNQYVETLLEQGLVGVMLFAAIIIGLFVATRQQKWLWAIIVAFLLQWNFFSGYPNALHVYLVFVVIYVACGKSRAVRSSPVA